MTKLLLSIFAIVSLSAWAKTDSISGVIESNKKDFQGILFIIALKHDGSSRMPLAVKRVQNPKFPLKFSLSGKDAMVKSVPFQGPFKIKAKLSRSGDALDNSGPEATTKDPVKLGDKDIKITLRQTKAL